MAAQSDAKAEGCVGRPRCRAHRLVESGSRVAGAFGPLTKAQGRKVGRRLRRLRCFQENLRCLARLYPAHRTGVFPLPKVRPERRCSKARSRVTPLLESPIPKGARAGLLRSPSPADAAIQTGMLDHACVRASTCQHWSDVRRHRPRHPWHQDPIPQSPTVQPPTSYRKEGPTCRTRGPGLGAPADGVRAACQGYGHGYLYCPHK